MLAPTVRPRQRIDFLQVSRPNGFECDLPVPPQGTSKPHVYAWPPRTKLYLQLSKGFYREAIAAVDLRSKLTKAVEIEEPRRDLFQATDQAATAGLEMCRRV